MIATNHLATTILHFHKAITFTMSPSAPISNCFAAHKYEYEISPEKSTCFNLQSQSKHIITETSLPMTKTIFLIRHAESDENRRKECFKTSVQGLGKLKLPTREDVVASMELMNLRAQLDSNVSPRGQAQVRITIFYIFRKKKHDETLVSIISTN